MDAKTKIVTVSGGFHGSPEIKLRLKVVDGRPVMSTRQADKLEAHMCGIAGCTCGIFHGWVVEGLSRELLAEVMIDARLEAYSRRSS